MLNGGGKKPKIFLQNSPRKTAEKIKRYLIILNETSRWNRKRAPCKTNVRRKKETQKKNLPIFALKTYDKFNCYYKKCYIYLVLVIIEVQDFFSVSLILL